MDSFLFYGDYAKQIQADNLQAIIGGNQSILDGIQKAAVEECKSYLKQKYDVTEAFENVTQYNFASTYKAGETVYLNATAYNALITYTIGKYTLYNGNVYTCTTAIVVAEAWNAAHWTLVGAQWATYYGLYPQPIFDYQKVYAIGDQVWWRDKTYTCRIATSILDHAAQLQINTPVDSLAVNIFPDDATKGVQYWGVGVSYLIPASTIVSNTTYWIAGDNRDQKLLMICIDIALYHAHCRISPRNVPELRTHRYMGVHEDRISLAGRVIYPTYSALGWLQSAADGTDITAEMPVIQPGEGHRIRFGGNTKTINQY